MFNGLGAEDNLIRDTVEEEKEGRTGGRSFNLRHHGEPQ